MVADNGNERETGARTLKEFAGPDPRDEFSQEAAENKKPKSGVGLTQRVGETHDNTRQSDSQDQPPGRLKIKRWGTKKRHSL